MELTPDLQKALTQLLVVALTVAAAAITTAWQNYLTKKALSKEIEQTKVDIDAAHDKGRAIAKEIGIEVTQNPNTREVHVTRASNPSSQAPTSQAPQGISQS